MHRTEGGEEALLRRLKERQDALIARVSRGNAPADNVVGGYMYLAGGVAELDAVITMVEEILFGRSTTPPVETKIWDDYGVRSP
jgi:hypothetical protein